jgi:hypothetical protein
MKHRGLPLLLAFGGLLLTTLLNANVILHTDGTATYNETIKPSSTVTVSGGDATFTGTVQSGSIIGVTGGMATFTGTIQNTVVFNLSGGTTLIDTLKNNATINVTGDAQLNLFQAVGNNATVTLEDTSTLQLEGDDIFANNTQLNATGGSILTQGYDFSVDSADISGTTTIDLGGTTGTVSLGTISGDGEIIFTNWTVDTVIGLDPASTIDATSQLVFDGAETSVGFEGASPIPEPATMALLSALAAAGFAIGRRKRSA